MNTKNKKIETVTIPAKEYEELKAMAARLDRAEKRVQILGSRLERIRQYTEDYA